MHEFVLLWTYWIHFVPSQRNSCMIAGEGCPEI